MKSGGNIIENNVDVAENVITEKLNSEHPEDGLCSWYFDGDDVSLMVDSEKFHSYAACVCVSGL
jgi:hypothetical protein